MCMFTEILDEPERTPEEIKKSREDRQSFIAQYLSDESIKDRREQHTIAIKKAMERINPNF